jgi:hypothetical protein
MSLSKVYDAITNANKEDLQLLNFRAHKILRQFPPRRHENKITYGAAGEKAVIRLLRKFTEVVEYNANHIDGAEYQNDIEVFDVPISLKTCANAGSKITIINKNGKKEHDISNINILILFIKQEKIALFPLKVMMPYYIMDTDSNISIHGSSWKWVLQNSEYIINLPSLSDEQKIYIDTLHGVDFNEELYIKYID